MSKIASLKCPQIIKLAVFGSICLYLVPFSRGDRYFERAAHFKLAILSMPASLLNRLFLVYQGFNSCMV